MTKLRNRVVETPRPNTCTEFSYFDPQLTLWCVEQYLRVNQSPIPLNNPNPFQVYFMDQQSRVIVTMHAGREYGTFSLIWFPESYEVLVSTNTYVSPNIRRRGIAKWLMGLKFRLAKEHGATTLLATVNANNTEENRTLDHFFAIWSRLTFLNPTLVLWKATLHGDPANRT